MSTAVLFKVVFGEPLKDAMKKGDGWKIPILIHKTTDYIKSKVSNATGIFKVAASKWKVQKLKEEFERGAVGLAKYNDPHSVAALLLLYLSSLPDPLLSQPQQTSICDAYRAKSTNDFIQHIRSVLHKTPLPNKLLLKYIFLFLHHVLANVASNKVDGASLAIAWAPIFFPSSPPVPISTPPDPPINSNEQLKITEILVEHFNSIWESSKTSASPIPTQDESLFSSQHAHQQIATLNADTKDSEKRAASPAPTKIRPSSALSSSSTKAKPGSPAGYRTSPVPKTPTPSKLNKSPSKKKDQLSKSLPTRNSTPPRTSTPPKPRTTTAQQRNHTPPIRHKPSSATPPLPPAPKPNGKAPPPLPQKPSTAPPSIQIVHETPRDLLLDVDTDLNSSDFNPDPKSGLPVTSFTVGSGEVVVVGGGSPEESGHDGLSTEGWEDEGFVADDEVEEGKSHVVKIDTGILFNNRLSGMNIPQLNLELVAPYDFPPAKGKKAKSAKKASSKQDSKQKPSFKKVPSFPKAVNKSLNLPKTEQTRSPSPQPPKKRPSSSTSSHATRSTTPNKALSSPNTTASAKHKEEPKKSLEVITEVVGDAELVARNKSLEAEILALRIKVKDDEEKLANEEKNVSFLLSRVEILDKQRMEAVNRIIDEKSQTEKDLQVRISSLEADVLVLKEQVKLTEQAADTKCQVLVNQNLHLEARLTLLQDQLDKAYEEIAEKDNRITLLEDEVVKHMQEGVDLVVLNDSENQYIDTPKPSSNSVPFDYHHPFSQPQSGANGYSHPPKLKEQAWSNHHPNGNGKGQQESTSFAV